ncbi:hypothetical protein RclHR1_09710008 [Rhizophagus clarus]|uniref:F-box domain-containing protein n=1 Tax=Rhizophagus clarus TaxID=94130 RepID=A0A2Z6SQN9_9GLOM|nr:hypothetical protein RclHR1_09710008 [Rhizophagus clarus]GES99179.1 hypothetical protein GLOIN_2v1885045 [Rhizophagus clarus]
MLELVEDVLRLILEELKYDRISLYSCILVNKAWCKITIPILWRDPGQNLLTDGAKNILFNVIILHLSDESRNNLKKQGIDLFKDTHESYERPLFNYISFWRYLNIHLLKSMIISIKSIRKFDKSDISIIRNEIFNIFINNSRNTKFLRLCFPQQFDYQLHRIPGAEHCFSKLESFRCYANTNKYILEGLAGISKSIRKLMFDIMYSINSGIIKLIEAQNNLKEVHFIDHTITLRNESFSGPLEESLIKHANTIQCLRIDWKPNTKVLSYLVNLISLDINSNLVRDINWNHLEKLSLPLLKYLKTQKVPSRILSNIIENTKGYLTEISILYEGVNDKNLIPIIYQNCPNLRYLKLSLSARNITEFENLLIKCQFLNGLVIDIYDHIVKFDWVKLFKILIKSSPISLVKFKFSSNRIISLENLKLFFDGWKNKIPMFLHIIPMYCFTRAEQRKQEQRELQQVENLIKEYKEREIIKSYYVDLHGSTFKDFEWIQKRSDSYIEF